MKLLPKISVRLLLFILLAVNVASCGKDPDKPGDNNNPDPKSRITIEFKKEASGQSFNRNDTLINHAGHKYTISVLRYYISNLRLVKEDNEEVALKEIAMVDYFLEPSTINNSANTKFTFDIEKGNYKALRFGLGVPENLNGIKDNNHNPGQYPADHPLSNTYSMSWPMVGNGSYIFTKLEGRRPGGAMAYHTGFDSLYRHVEMAKNMNIAAGTEHNFNIMLDVNRIFSNPEDQIDITKDNFTHATGTGFNLARRFTENFIKAHRVQ